MPSRFTFHASRLLKRCHGEIVPCDEDFVAVFVGDISEIVRQDLREGRHRNPTDDLTYFTDAYFHRIDEIEAEIVEAGFTYKQTLAVEGPGWLLADFEVWWDDEDRQKRLLDLLRSVERERSMLGVSAHLLGIARK